ncbi:hypothetical protein BOTBODRAFT_69983 [Botryobasidium botryosum FD-172 SS1]|uniref:Uncharacterized protein n=1 Tax=Botryobasidium botryosum (strain FD-172 SS1) TaxID=930990 RepID=A0A067M8B8_BOTB1|nr:hypothetical protein BOTBODRAFT_69983 [Botryobasidium botryosum FD-172 SS1]
MSVRVSLPHPHHSEKNLAETKEVSPGVFACLYRSYGLYILSLLDADGVGVDPTSDGFELRNLTHNVRVVLVHTEDHEETIFTWTLNYNERYSLQHQGVEVWACGEVRPMALPPTPVGR